MSTRHCIIAYIKQVITENSSSPLVHTAIISHILTKNYMFWKTLLTNAEAFSTVLRLATFLAFQIITTFLCPSTTINLVGSSINREMRNNLSVASSSSKSLRLSIQRFWHNKAFLFSHFLRLKKAAWILLGECIKFDITTITSTTSATSPLSGTAFAKMKVMLKTFYRLLLWGCMAKMALNTMTDMHNNDSIMCLHSTFDL